MIENSLYVLKRATHEVLVKLLTSYYLKTFRGEKPTKLERDVYIAITECYINRYRYTGSAYYVDIMESALRKFYEIESSGRDYPTVDVSDVEVLTVVMDYLKDKVDGYFVEQQVNGFVRYILPKTKKGRGEKFYSIVYNESMGILLVNDGYLYEILEVKLTVEVKESFAKLISGFDIVEQQ